MSAMRLIPAALLIASVTFAAQPPTTVEERQRAWEIHQQLRSASPFRPLEWRAVGPKMVGGRIEAIAVAPDDPFTIYAGGAGNLWKTTNNGITWTPVFEHEDAFAIGDVAVAPSNADVVWVGTGEVQPRYAGFAFSGTGVFRSTDGGATWRNMGLRDSHHIPKILIDPNNPDVVFVAAMGHQWTPNEERGVFRTTDGGRSWAKVLYVDDTTGVIDMAMDPSDAKTIYAAAWHLPAGPQSAIYRTTDGGATWTKLTHGLPAGPLGRMGLAVAPGRPSTVYAFIDNQMPLPRPRQDRRIVGAELYRSDDRGDTWHRANGDDLYAVFTEYGWKFCDVRVSPDNRDDVYILGNRGYHSTDGGRTFEPFGEQILRLHDTEGKVLHLDQHEIWIDPRNPDRVIVGNDGGVFMSYDRARTWLHVNNLPISQFYAVDTDMQEPYTIYGGTQDDAAVYGPSDVPLADAAADLWRHVYLDRWTGGDSFDTRPDPTDPRIVYYEHQNGDLRRMDITGSSVQTSGPFVVAIRPRAPKGEAPWRIGWYMPFVISQFDPKTLYAGANKVLKSTDRGDHWTAISPDISLPAGGDRAVVPYGTITMIAESPLQSGLLYAGTEGGTVWLTKDEGGAWKNVSAGLPSKWVTRVIASRWNAGTVYVSLSGYRTDDFRPYLFVSTDFGATWRSIANNLPAECINVVREDPGNRDVLYVGTDLGVYASLDRGASWISLVSNLPSTPVEDLVVHARDDEIVIGTHGRSVFVLDARPVQEWTASADEPLHVFAIRPMAVRDGDDIEPSRPRAEGRVLFRLQEARPVRIEISDARGTVVRTLTFYGGAGLNVAEWDGQINGDRVRYAAPGTYRVHVSAGDWTATRDMTVTRYGRRY